jgi:hypothetical protein
MVTDLIKIPCIKNLVFRDHRHSYPESILNVTLHNIIITHKESDGNYKELWVRYFIKSRNLSKYSIDFLYKYGRYSTKICNEK